MSNNSIEISGDQTYYVEVINGELESPINLEIVQDNNHIVEISSANTFITYNFPSGYPINATSGILSYDRVSFGYPASGLSGLGSSVSGLLVAGDDIIIEYNNDFLTISVDSDSIQSKNKITVKNSGIGRVLTSDGSTSGITAQEKFRFNTDNFDNSTLSLIGNLNVSGAAIFGEEAQNLVSIGFDIIGSELGLSKFDPITSNNKYIACYLSYDNTFRYGGNSVNPAITINNNNNNIGVKNFQPQYSLDVSGVGNFSQNLLVNNIPVSLSGHTHTTNEVSSAYKNVSSSANLTSSDEIIFADCNLNNVVLTIPSASGVGGKKMYIKKISGNNDLIVQCQSGQTIDGYQNTSLTYVNQAITLISDNINWFIF